MTDYILIPLHGKHGAGKFAKVDSPDAQLVRQYRWHVQKPTSEHTSKPGYVYTKRGGQKALHRMLVGARSGQIVDHINGDALDNRRSNLRLCEHGQNIQNQVKRTPGTSIYKGVYLEVSRGTRRWRAQIVANKRKHHLGSFGTELEAALAYDEAALRLHGEFARTNF